MKHYVCLYACLSVYPNIHTEIKQTPLYLPFQDLEEHIWVGGFID